MGESLRVGFPESVLADDEQVALHLHPHWKIMVRPVTVLVVVAGLVVAAAIWLPDRSWAPWATLVVAAIGLLVLLRLTLWPLMVWRTTHYVFTTHRVLLRTGVLSRSGRDVPLARVNDVSFGHSLLERMLGCGTLVIESAGERGQLTLSDIPRVEHVQSRLYQLVEDDDARRAAEREHEDARGGDPGY